MRDDQVTPNERVLKIIEDATGHQTIMLLEQQDRTRGALRMFDSRSKSPYGRAILPTSLHKQALLMYHNQHGHPSTMQTAATLRLTYYCYIMDKDINEYIRECTYCQRYKALNRVTDTPIKAYGAPEQPFDSIHMDLTGCKLNQWIKKSAEKLI